jgi:hypothetical protein
MQAHGNLRKTGAPGETVLEALTVPEIRAPLSDTTIWTREGRRCGMNTSNQSADRSTLRGRRTEGVAPVMVSTYRLLPGVTFMCQVPA